MRCMLYIESPFRITFKLLVQNCLYLVFGLRFVQFTNDGVGILRNAFFNVIKIDEYIDKSLCELPSR